MIYAKDFRNKALDNLRGKWLSVFIIIIITAAITLAFQIASQIYLTKTGITYDIQNLESVMNYFGSAEYRISTLISWGGIVVSAFLGISVCWVYLQVADDKKPEFNQFAGTLKRAGESFILELLKFIKIFLWTLLFIIPGIIKVFAYYMSLYIKTENPQMSSFKAIAESNKMMKGNKARLFFLLLSFIGWYFLVGLGTFLIGLLFTGSLSFITDIIQTLLTTFVTIYSGCAVASFYKDLKDRNSSSQK